ncbi:DUF3883 domain-containing protein [Cryobacterium cheniae]|uniref:DUF3883 domain-containing protein n=1 Tax=Cryobacterium cheniae TaxID=1259262 RepID=UPI00141BAB0B|nr:DUF3883 domain-containing protein [Cryobacterium cheniae]
MTSIFHLANSMRHTSHQDVRAWVHAAGDRSSFLAAAIDHRPAAEFLIDASLVVQEAAITPSPRLKALSRQADRPTLVAIARLLLEISPPPWLPFAVDGQVRYEFIPWSDLQGLAWLRPELDQLLVDTACELLQHSDSVALGLGRAAELTVFAALDNLHASPVHVSEISDRFGYDIETVRGSARRWEVKGCTKKTSGSFHLSRNEFEKCKRYPDEWRLVQVVFSPGALTADFLTRSHILAIRELFSGELIDLAPSETGTFYWETSARISPQESAWVPSLLKAPSDFRLPSIDKLGQQALQMRSMSQKDQQQTSARATFSSP